MLQWQFLVVMLLLTLRNSFAVLDENIHHIRMHRIRRTQMRGISMPVEDYGNTFNVSSSGYTNFTEWLLEGHLAFCQLSGFCEDYQRDRCVPCGTCFCDESCVLYNDCCPDLKLIDANTDSKYSCRSVLYGGIPEHIYRTRHRNHHAYQMIEVCPNSLLEIAQDCANSPLLPPVTAMDNRTIFKNEFCARCNNVSRTQAWKLSISCTVNIGFDFNTQSELLITTASHPNCSLTHQPQPYSVDLRPCDHEMSTIFSCNVTGLWQVYNEFVERACSSYIQTKLVDGQKYSNPFCYICNTADYSALDRCDTTHRQVFPKPFEALIDFAHDPNPPKELLNTRCPLGNVYDRTKNQCITVSCAFGKVLVGQKCIPLVDNAKGLAYELYFGITFSETVWIKDIKRLLGQLETYFINVSLDNDARSMQFSLTFDSRFNSTYCLNRTKEASVYFKLVVTRVVDQNKFEHMLLKIRNSSINLGYLNLTTSLEYLYSNCIITNQCSVGTSDCMWNISRFVQNEDDFEDYDHFFIPVNGLLRCPQVILELDIFTIDMKSGILTWQNTTLPPDLFQIQSDGRARICLEYFNKVTVNDQDEPSQESQVTPEVLLSIICTALSLLCLSVTFLIYCVFETLRSMPGLNNVNLVVALWVAQVIYLVGSGQTENQEICKVLGVIIHYLWLSAFCAMNICSFHMFRVFTTMRNRNELSHKRTFLRYTTYIYGLPAVVVGITIGWYVAQSNGEIIGYGGTMCYLSEAMGIGIAFGLPVGLIVMSNTVFFILTMRAIHNRPNLTRSKADINHIIVYIKMSSLTGISWIIGFVAILTKFKPLIYIFTFTNASQGVFLFISFVCNSRVWQLIRENLTRLAIRGVNTSSSYALNTSDMETEQVSIPRYEASKV